MTRSVIPACRQRESPCYDGDVMNNIELVIFDLGRVLLDFDFMKVIRELKRHSPHSEAEIRRYFKTTPLWDAFERGDVAPKAFFKHLQKDLQLTGLDFKSFIPLWNDIFEEKEDSIAILSRLKGNYQLAMISNVNPMHWEHVAKKHSFMKWFDIPIASYAVGHRKPELEIYHLTLKKAKMPAERSIFIDDVHAHIHAARSIGIRGHHFKTAKKLKNDLSDILD
jgi:FMN phosphatase YigB (HAD superfamily)